MARTRTGGQKREQLHAEAAACCGLLRPAAACSAVACVPSDGRAQRVAAPSRILTSRSSNCCSTSCREQRAAHRQGDRDIQRMELADAQESGTHSSSCCRPALMLGAAIGHGTRAHTGCGGGARARGHTRECAHTFQRGVPSSLSSSLRPCSSRSFNTRAVVRPLAGSTLWLRSTWSTVCACDGGMVALLLLTAEARAERCAWSLTECLSSAL